MASLSKIGKSAGLIFGAGAVFGAARGVAESDPLAYGINAGFDAFLGSPDIDNTILGSDLRFRDLAGFTNPLSGLGSVSQDFSRSMNYIRPRENPADMFSGRSINKTPFKLLNVDEDKINKPYISKAKYNTENEYSNMPGSIYPQRLSSRQWDSATGDVVLGSYNLRHG